MTASPAALTTLPLLLGSIAIIVVLIIIAIAYIYYYNNYYYYYHHHHHFRNNNYGGANLLNHLNFKVSPSSLGIGILPPAPLAQHSIDILTDNNTFTLHSPIPYSSLSLLSSFHHSTIDCIVPYDSIEWGRLLGSGSQGEVYECKWRGSDIAVKKVDLKSLSPLLIEEFCKEASIMKLLRHPSITLFMGISIQPPNLCILTELVKKGSLFDLIHDETIRFPFSRVLSLALDICNGMAYLHSNKPSIIHRDLKSLNILVDQHWKAKVADFGMTRSMALVSADINNINNNNNLNTINNMTQCGSPIWMSPEMIKNEQYNEKTDVYSFGIILWELYTREIPYKELNLSPSALVIKVVKEQIRPIIPSNCPRIYAKIIEKCWATRAEKRPSFNNLVETFKECLADSRLMNHKCQVEEGRAATLDVAATVNEKEEEETRKLMTALTSKPEDIWNINQEEIIIIAKEEKLDDLTQESSTIDQTHQTQSQTPRVALPLLGVGLEEQPSYATQSVVSSSSVRSKPFFITIHSLPDSLAPSSNELDPLLSSHISNSALAYNSLINSSSKHIHYISQGECKEIGKYRGQLVAISRTPLHSCFALTNQQKIEADIKGISSPSPFESLLTTLSRLRHPNLQLSIGAYTEKDSIVMVEEYMTRGNLENIISDASIILPWDTNISFLVDIAHALAYLHLAQPPIIHHDLNPNCIKIDTTWRVKVGGYAYTNMKDFIKNKGITLPSINVWSAPELINAKQEEIQENYEKEAYQQRLVNTITPASNIYSFGLLMFYIHTRKYPYNTNLLTPSLIKRIEEGDSPLDLENNSMSPLYRKLLKECVKLNPMERPTFSEIGKALTSIAAAGPARISLTTALDASLYIKKAIVWAYRSRDPVTLWKDWGKNIGRSGSWLIYSGQGDVYVVDADVFISSYEPIDIHNFPHQYRKRGSVLALRMSQAFAVKTSNGIENGMEGDYLIENTEGEQWSVDAETFRALYEEIRKG